MAQEFSKFSNTFIRPYSSISDTQAVDLHFLDLQKKEASSLTTSSHSATWGRELGRRYLSFTHFSGACVFTAYRETACGHLEQSVAGAVCFLALPSG